MTTVLPVWPIRAFMYPHPRSISYLVIFWFLLLNSGRGAMWKPNGVNRNGRE